MFCPDVEAVSHLHHLRFYVQKHCDEFASTVCASCPPSTYTDEPNGLLQCKACTVCDPKVGLKVRRACSLTSDTLCEPLEGHWCTDPIKDGCRGAAEHIRCSSGQYIEQRGTASSDTTCGTCEHGTFSDGVLTSCRSQ
ncbi:tumor necrosis factor receptor superfamily member 14-like [Alosa sapidissima]|uniref:tumor necrosis factor receptor superfamily member 14-like n=1 Tax=Alosa sapidissima TaxID=34773 RepID=UPI001C098B26|nr:tumor necrosis factor receptor superfamily member 14-like [Alosa sapidissima]